MDNSPKPSMAPPSANVQDIIRRGGEIYNGLKAVLEPANNGKYVVIEVSSGKHFLGDTRDEATVNARKEFPDQIMFIRRVGQVEKSSRHFPVSHYKYARLF